MFFLPHFFLILILSAAGSFFNIPLGKRKIILIERPYFFGLFKKSYMVAQGISINVGGAVIPVALAMYFLFQMELNPAFVAIACMSIVSKFFSKVVPGRGVMISPFVVSIISVVLAFIIAPNHIAPVAFTSGVLGVLIGADLLNIPKILKQGESRMLCIGGAGVFDGIFLIGVFSALLSGL